MGGLSQDIKCSDCLYFIDATSTCEEYHALVEPEEIRNCYFFRALPIDKDEPSIRQNATYSAVDSELADLVLTSVANDTETISKTNIATALGGNTETIKQINVEVEIEPKASMEVSSGSWQ